MNEELKKIFSIDIDNEFDQILYNTFTHTLKKRASLKINDETLIDEPYHPGVAWLAFKGVDEDTDFTNPNWWKPYAIKEIHKDFQDTIDKNAIMTYKEKTDEDKSKILRSMYLIEKVWPEAKEQINQFVSEIMLFESNGEYNGASGWAYGTLFITFSSTKNSIDMIDVLIHEAGHLVLMAKQSFGKMIENDGDSVYSPIRNEKRWLNGVIHAIYVYSKVCEALVRLEDLESELTLEERETAIKNYQNSRRIYIESVKNLDEVAIYTETGTYLMKQLRENLKQFEDKTTLFEKKTL